MTDRRDRRSFLRAGVALGSLGIAGCLDLGGDSGEPDGNTDGEPNGTDPPNGTGSQPDGTDGNGTDSDGDTSDPGGEDPEPDPDPVTSWPMQQFDAQNTAAVPAPSPAEVEEDWQFETDDDMEISPVVAGDTVYVGDESGNIYAIDQQGNKRWSASVLNGRIDSTPAIYEDLLVVPFQEQLRAYDRFEGTEQWRYPSQYGTHELTVADGAIFFADTGRHVHAVDARSGDRRWRFQGQVDLSSYLYAPAVHDGEVVVVRSAGARTDTREISAIGIEEGNKRPLVRTTDFVFKTPVTVVDGHFLVGASDGVHAYDSSGSERWHFPTDRPVQSSLAVTNETVHAMSSDGGEGSLYAIALDEGTDRWAIQTSNSWNTGPVVCGGFVVWGHLGPEIESTQKAARIQDGEIVWTKKSAVAGYHQCAVGGDKVYLAGTGGFVDALQIV